MCSLSISKSKLSFPISLYIPPFWVAYLKNCLYHLILMQSTAKLSIYYQKIHKNTQWIRVIKLNVGVINNLSSGWNCCDTVYCWLICRISEEYRLFPTDTSTERFTNWTFLLSVLTDNLYALYSFYTFQSLQILQRCSQHLMEEKQQFYRWILLTH